MHAAHTAACWLLVQHALHLLRLPLAALQPHLQLPHLLLQRLPLRHTRQQRPPQLIPLCTLAPEAAAQPGQPGFQGLQGGGVVVCCCRWCCSLF
jgi:hypothetical protein